MNELFAKMGFPSKLLFLLVILASLTLITEPGWSLFLLYKHLPQDMFVYLLGWATSWYIFYMFFKYIQEAQPYQARHDVPEMPEVADFVAEIEQKNPNKGE